MTEAVIARPTASLVVPSYRGASRLPALFDSLAAQKAGTPQFEVIVVIDGVDDGTMALVEAETRFAVRTILFSSNRGRVAALNSGFDAAWGDVLIRCDDDLILAPSHIASHVALHHGSEQPVAGVGLTRDVHPPSPYARAYGRDAARRFFLGATSCPPDRRWHLWAANCSIARETWERIGLYDDRYRGYGWEDVDYGYRLHAAGLPLLLVEGATAEHHGPARTVRARARKAFDSGAARATFQSLHPQAPLPPARPRGGIWAFAVRRVAGLLRDRGRVELAAEAVDRALRLVPEAVGRKLVALVVEASAYAGNRMARVPLGPDGDNSSDDLSPGSGLRVAIAHDYLTQRGGAERVVLSLLKAFPDAELHTLFYEPEQTYPEFRDRTIHVSPLNRIGPLRRDPRFALPLLPPFAVRRRIDADVVIASSTGWAHAFPTNGRKIIYCHSPARWLYLPEDYLGRARRLSPARLMLSVLAKPLHHWDQRAARTADEYLANSTVVRERIETAYGIHARTLFPPFSAEVAEGPQQEIPDLAYWGEQGGHYLVVSRLQPYKHVDVVIEAFRAMPERRLLIIGKGPLREQLRAIAPDNVRLVEGLTDGQMRWAYANARALIAASHEDFGLSPLEAGAHGIPTLALRAGGYLDTITEGVNGLFFDSLSPSRIGDAVDTIPGLGFDPVLIRQALAQFSEDAFIHKIRFIVEEQKPEVG